MRLLPIDQAIDSFVAEDIYDLNGRILVKKNNKLSATYADRIKNAGYSSVYILEPLLDVETQPLIPTELRNDAVNKIKTLHQLIRDTQNKGLEIHNLIDDLLKLGLDLEYELNARRMTTIDYIDIKSTLTYTYEHCVATAMLAFLLAKSLSYSPQEMSQIFVGALFHDIGMAAIDETVFMKNGKLNLEEFVKIKEHPKLGHGLIKDLPQFNAYTKVVVLQHHEKLDGTGYPNKLVGKDIHPYAKLVSVCDIYDAMTSDRPYSKAVEPSKALEYLDSASNTQLDAVSTLHFLSILMPYPKGTVLTLSTGDLAVVTENNPLWPLRPHVHVINPTKKALSQTINLVDVPNIQIESVYYEKL